MCLACSSRATGDDYAGCSVLIESADRTEDRAFANRLFARRITADRVQRPRRYRRALQADPTLIEKSHASKLEYTIAATAG